MPISESSETITIVKILLFGCLKFYVVRCSMKLVHSFVNEGLVILRRLKNFIDLRFLLVCV